MPCLPTAHATRGKQNQKTELGGMEGFLEMQKQKMDEIDFLKFQNFFMTKKHRYDILREVICLICN